MEQKKEYSKPDQGAFEGARYHPNTARQRVEYEFQYH